MLPGVLVIEQDGYALLRGHIGFCLRDLPPGGVLSMEWSSSSILSHRLNMDSECYRFVMGTPTSCSFN
jgi:hypothetical protein